MTLRPILFASVFTTLASFPASLPAHDPAEAMAEAAQRFLAALDPAATKQAVFEFKSDQRQFWHFVPDKFIKPGGKRYGLKVRDMNAQQRLLAHALLSSGLSHQGYSQSVTIMTLEAILHDLENKNPIRDPELYYVSIFGKPSTEKTWGWRLEGHHLSVNFTLVKGKLFSVTPSFFGTNPAEVKSGPMKGLKVLAAEESLARKLLGSLSAEQRKLAIIAAKAPSDILTGQDRKANKGIFTPVKGIAFEKLGKEQQAMLLRLVNEYAAKYRPEIVAQIDKRQKIADGKDMMFAWAGGTNPGDGHYYRVQTPAFLFEYDSTQNDANHVHAVWRHFDGDFGEDLLRKHYETSSHHGSGKSGDASSDGWVRIFDGKTLDGWKSNESAASFRVEDGAIVVQGKPRSHLFYTGSEKPFQNFEFKAEVNCGAKANSGVYFHTKWQDRGWPKYGYECQVNNTFHDPAKTGSLYHVDNVLKSPVSDGEWFRLHIKVSGKQVVVKVNDQKVVDYTEPEGKKPGKRFRRILEGGTFALQAHDPKSVVRFRKLQVKRLP